MKLNNTLIREYLLGKQTLIQLATRFKCSTRTIQRHLDLVKISSKEISIKPRQVALICDCTSNCLQLPDFGKRKDKFLPKCFTKEKLLSKYSLQFTLFGGIVFIQFDHPNWLEVVF